MKMKMLLEIFEIFYAKLLLAMAIMQQMQKFDFWILDCENPLLLWMCHAVLELYVRRST